jgi:lipopolysaccharide export system protein LptA
MLSCIPLAVACIVLAAGAAAAAGANRITLRSFTVEAKNWEGPIRGPWEWSKEVVVTGPGVTITCDRLKMWLTEDGRDAERVEAAGNIVVRGSFVAADKTEWKIAGKAETATYDGAAGRGTLQGSVSFEATNPVTGAVLSVQAHKLIYDLDTRHFRFERSDKKPVRVEWTEPEPEPKPEPAAQQQSGAGGG